MDTMVPTAQAAPAAPLVLSGSPGLRAPAARVQALPGPRGSWPFGNALQVRPLGGLHAAAEHWAEAFGPLFRFRLGTRTLVGVADHELIAEVLRHRPHGFARGERLADRIREAMGTGVFIAEGDAWRRQRRLVMRALTPEHVRRFFPVLREVTTRLEAKWRRAARRGEPVDVARDLKCYSVDVASWLAMGEDVDTLGHPDNPLQADVEFWFAMVGRRLVAPIPYWRWVKLPYDRRADAVVARLRAVVARLVDETRARLAREPARRARPANIVEALVAARDEAGSEFDDADVAGNVATMLFAGEDTAANAMAWLMFHLVSHPEARAAAVAEADAALGGATVPIAFDDLDGLPYLEAAAAESMRLKPIAPIIGATARVEADLAGLRVAPGQILMLAQRFASRRSGAFAQPDRFDPSRWLGAAGADIDDPKRRMFPFGGGPRYCPGRYLAMCELKMAVATALRAFDWRLVGDADAVRERMTFTMAPSALSMRLTERAPA